MASDDINLQPTKLMKKNRMTHLLKTFKYIEMLWKELEL